MSAIDARTISAPAPNPRLIEESRQFADVELIRNAGRNNCSPAVKPLGFTYAQTKRPVKSGKIDRDAVLMARILM